MKRYQAFGIWCVAVVVFLCQPVFAQSYTAKRKGAEEPATTAPQQDPALNNEIQQEPACSKDELSNLAAYDAMIKDHYAAITKMKDDLMADYPSIDPYPSRNLKDKDRKKPAGRSVSSRDIKDIERRSKAMNEKNDKFMAGQAYKDAAALHRKCGVKMPRSPQQESADWLFGDQD